MTMDSRQRRHLLKFIHDLEKHKGRHTELVSVYVPAGYDIVKIMQHLSQEQGTATNIKDSTTRKNVIDSIERMLQSLKLYKKTPDNGLAIFAGNVAEREGQQDIEVFQMEPPEQLNFRLYRCDKTFVTDALKEIAEKKEIYGLVVMDKREGNVALLRGKKIIPLTTTTSIVPGKTRAGGQCVLPNTLIQSATGDIFEIEKSHNPNAIAGSMIKDFSIKNSPITDKWDTKKNQVYKIITKSPRLEIECSPDHFFFVNEDKIIEKPAEDLRIGDFLLMAEKIDFAGHDVHFNPIKYYNSYKITKEGIELLKKRRLKKGLHQKQLAKSINVTQTAISLIELGKRAIKPNFLKRICSKFTIDFEEFLEKYSVSKDNVNLPYILDEKLAQILGYFLGDGNFEEERITFSEQTKEVAEYYEKLIKEIFNTNTNLKFRKEKNYWQLRVYGKSLVRFLKSEFPEINTAKESAIPKKILESNNKISARFIRGLFDAEGYVHISRKGIGLGVNNKKLIQQLQVLFLRFGVIASMDEYDNKRNPYTKNHRFTIDLTEKKSLERFKEKIGFTSSIKSKKLENVIANKSKKSEVRQIVVQGSKIRGIIEKTGYNMQLFPKVSGFFRNKRMMGKEAFNNSILKPARQKDKRLYEELKKIYDYPILPVKIARIEIRKEETKMVDISTGAGNFIANCLIVHNSAHRFEQLREGAAKEFFNKLAEYVKNDFLGNKDIKGILVGGPGHTKNEWVDGNFITDLLKQKIIAIKDLSYTGDFGLQELVDKSQDVLANEEIATEKKMMQRFFEKLAKNSKECAYGEMHVRKALGQGAADVLLLSEELSDEIIEELEKIAEQYGTKVELISTETREGVQLRDMGKYAAILRYEVH